MNLFNWFSSKQTAQDERYILNLIKRVETHLQEWTTLWGNLNPKLSQDSMKMSGLNVLGSTHISNKGEVFRLYAISDDYHATIFDTSKDYTKTTRSQRKALSKLFNLVHVKDIDLLNNEEEEIIRERREDYKQQEERGAEIRQISVERRRIKLSNLKHRLKVEKEIHNAKGWGFDRSERISELEEDIQRIEPSVEYCGTQTAFNKSEAVMNPAPLSLKLKDLMGFGR